MEDQLVEALTEDTRRDIEAWARALWRAEQPDATAFADRLAAAMLLGVLDGAAGGEMLGRHSLELCCQRYALPRGGLFKSVFKELVDALKRKNPILAVLSPRQIDPQLRQTAFFVSGVTSSNILEQIQDELIKARTEGVSESTFIERAAAISDRTAPELDNVWRTNVASAAGAGRWAQLNDPDTADMYVGYRYASRKKATTRPLHAAMDGFIAAKDDPIWRIIWVPNGYRCLCWCRGVKRDQAEQVGLIDSNGRVINQRVYANEFQEEVVSAALSGSSIEVEGHEMKFPDEGFRGNALAGLVA
jgi:SPP1 gp7 family putative phage head morphogenesis protein